jgi:hypothetical protein
MRHWLAFGFLFVKKLDKTKLNYLHKQQFRRAFVQYLIGINGFIFCLKQGYKSDWNFFKKKWQKISSCHKR